MGGGGGGGEGIFFLFVCFVVWGIFEYSGSIFLLSVCNSKTESEVPRRQIKLLSFSVLLHQPPRCLRAGSFTALRSQTGDLATLQRAAKEVLRQELPSREPGRKAKPCRAWAPPLLTLAVPSSNTDRSAWRRLQEDFTVAPGVSRRPIRKLEEGFLKRPVMLGKGTMALAEGRDGTFDLDGRKKSFTVGVVRHCNKLPRKAVDGPSLDVSKAKLDGALSNLV